MKNLPADPQDADVVKNMKSCLARLQREFEGLPAIQLNKSGGIQWRP
jgi:hypothetical protein